MERQGMNANGEMRGFESLMGALRFTNSVLHEQLTGCCITFGPDKRYYVTRFSGYEQLSSLGHEVISLF
ncbi:hypothetical protein [Tellurirhabdus rosea]|uniref:hypothetical protein n=1 Tax=Tellurirhabdus rosea TaxID=2674997 RepID=UPI00224CC79C|nr:hypothetical protein [Tellurirhabdus rosea]